jgi:hypothetical protein
VTTVRTPTAGEIAEEQLSAIPDNALSLARLVRRKLLRGEEVRPSVFAAEYKCSPTIITGAVRSLEAAGYRVSATFEPANSKGGGGRPRRVFKLASSTPVVTPPTEDEAVKLPRTTKARTARKAPARKASKAVAPVAAAPVASEPPPVEVNGSNGVIDLGRLPTLLQQVSVFALAANDDGSITIGLRDEQTRWLLTLTGQHER